MTTALIVTMSDASLTSASLTSESPTCDSDESIDTMAKFSTPRGPTQEGDSGDGAKMDSLPLTGYATLGLLSPREWFTAIEVQERGHQQLRHFYWAPALSHVRRELNRLDDLAYVESRIVQQGRIKRTLKYRITELGSQALAEWAERPEFDPLVVKNAVILRLWLGRRADNANLVLQALERHIEHVDGELKSLDAQIVSSAARLHERIAAMDSPSLSGEVTIQRRRAAWHGSVMEYCRRGYENELQNSNELLKELRMLADEEQS